MKKNLSKTALLFIIIICSSFIITRSDVNDQRYLDYGKNGGFESLAIFNDGNGTLIDKQWVITASHVADDQKEGSIVKINNQDYSVAKIVMYPHRYEDDLTKKKDIALIMLNKIVEGVIPASYSNVSPTAGTTIHLAGTGDTGTGVSGPNKMDKKKRGATNSLDEVTDMHIKFTFNKPNDKNVTPLEGISGPGDSGGPAYIKENGKLTIIGVSSFQIIPDNIKEGHYGVKEYYQNVSSYADWIKATINGEQYYKTTMDGKKIVSIKHIDGTYYLGVNGKKAKTEDLIKYGEKVLLEYNNLRAEASAKKHRAPDKNDPQMQFAFYLQDLMKSAGIDKQLREVAISISAKEFTVDGKKMAEDLKNKALEKFEKLFGQPIGHNQINLRPRN